MVELPVFRAPMRSRDDRIPAGSAVARALERGLCGLGGRLDTVPQSLRAAVARTAEAIGERAAQRLERFAAAPHGAFVWAKDAYDFLWLGRLTGDWHYDSNPGAWAVDLVHVRACTWSETPIPHDEAPPSVNATYARGGRNWQRIRDERAAPDTVRLWERFGVA
ncbi:hypothetical protein HD600_000132 [Microbacterium ginsengiterrae]|uniref:GAF domain-containing protein n=1 Tax=Microbacterium ginsengiterrae TaxID=546115 RepID=A0A7W9C9T6_9MICO|nr:GAF domain-containing protein [Microbacterium ginsengiterrae]MBB5741635.1 hypothetical protein [Microbacterium ginsengiterrae]